MVDGRAEKIKRVTEGDLGSASLAEAAAVVGVTPSTISKWRNLEHAREQDRHYKQRQRNSGREVEFYAVGQETFPPERPCIEGGCITILCCFNPGPYCWMHAAQHAEADVVAQRDEWEELMAA